MTRQTNNRVKVGIIGSGAIAQNRVLPSFPATRDCELWSIHNRNKSIADDLAQKFGAHHGTDSIEDLLADKHLDAVYVASPVDCHLDHALSICQANKHLLLEKPLARNSAEAAQIIEACERAGIVAMEAYMMKFHPAHEKLRELVASNALGKVVTARARLGCWHPPMKNSWRQDPARSGGGVLFDIGCHLLDLLRWLLGPIKSVTGKAANMIFDYPADDTAVGMVEFEHGGIGIIECYFCLPDEFVGGELEISGTEAKVTCQGTLGQCGSGTMRIERSASRHAAEMPVEQDTHTYSADANLYARQLDRFAEYILTGTKPTMSTLPEGAEIIALLADIYAHRHTG